MDRSRRDGSNADNVHNNRSILSNNSMNRSRSDGSNDDSHFINNSHPSVTAHTNRSNYTINNNQTQKNNYQPGTSRHMPIGDNALPPPPLTEIPITAAGIANLGGSMLDLLNDLNSQPTVNVRTDLFQNDDGRRVMTSPIYGGNLNQMTRSQNSIYDGVVRTGQDPLAIQRPMTSSTPVYINSFNNNISRESNEIIDTSQLQRFFSLPMQNSLDNHPPRNDSNNRTLMSNESMNRSERVGSNGDNGWQFGGDKIACLSPLRWVTYGQIGNRLRCRDNLGYILCHQ